MNDTLSKILFDLDPAGTCCKENDAYDEYDSIASEILVDERFDGLTQSINDNFKFYFGIDLDAELVEIICQRYNK